MSRASHESYLSQFTLPQADQIVSLLNVQVDAALDESNQASVAQLLSLLSHGALPRTDPSSAAPPHRHKATPGNAIVRNVVAGPVQGPGVQIICVSHQPAFQKACNALVHISRDERGTNQQQVMNRAATTAGGTETMKPVATAKDGDHEVASKDPKRHASAAVQAGKASKVAGVGRGRGGKKRGA